MNFTKIISKLKQMYWDNRWMKGRILYKNRTDSKPQDVRQFLKNNPLPSELAEWCDSLEGGSDQNVKECLKWVINNIVYKTDEEQWGKPEYWQTPKETYKLRTGDCEDMSIILLHMLRIAGIPAFRRKIACGLVRNTLGIIVGHAYCLYLTEEGNWTTLDPAFYPEESLQNFGLPHSQVANYGAMWFTFNEENSWHQKSTIFLF